MIQIKYFIFICPLVRILCATCR